MKLILIFLIANVTLTIGIFEAILFIVTKHNTPRFRLVFGLIQPIIALGSLSTVWLLIPYLTPEERADNLIYGLMIWGITILIYSFKRFFKKQEELIEKNV